MGFIGFGDLATVFRDGPLVPSSIWHRRGTRDLMPQLPSIAAHIYHLLRRSSPLI
jgi:hypothetical protein